MSPFWRYYLIVSGLIVLAFVILTSAFGASIGGRRTPNGTEIQIDLPGRYHRENISSRGSGCCVFRSLDHAARWQNLPVLYGMPEWMRSNGIPGGGWPEKASDLIARIAKERNLPVPKFIQVQNRDLEILKVACRTGRMPCVTYGYSPTGRYGRRRIAHMVNLVHADDDFFCVLDNNFPGVNQYEWMSPKEFLHTYAYRQMPGWAIILLPSSPPPIPVNYE